MKFIQCKYCVACILGSDGSHRCRRISATQTMDTEGAYWRVVDPESDDGCCEGELRPASPREVDCGSCLHRYECSLKGSELAIKCKAYTDAKMLIEAEKRKRVEEFTAHRECDACGARVGVDGFAALGRVLCGACSEKV